MAASSALGNERTSEAARMRLLSVNLGTEHGPCAI